MHWGNSAGIVTKIQTQKIYNLRVESLSLREDQTAAAVWRKQSVPAGRNNAAPICIWDAQIGYFVSMSAASILSVILSISGMFVAAILVGLDIAWHGYCPMFARIPACYIVFCAFIAVLTGTATHRRWSPWLFWTGAITGLFLAVWFATGHVLKLAFCPVFNGIPLCFVSLAVFCALMALRIRAHTS